MSLIRDPGQKVVSGLCASVAKSLKIETTIVRLGFFFLTLATGILPGVATYLAGWIITPTNEKDALSTRILNKNRNQEEFSEGESDSGTVSR